MKLWSEFYNLLIPELPGCPILLIDHTVRRAAIQFCEQSLAWKYQHPDIAVVTTTDEYSFVPLDQTIVHAITYAEFNGLEIKTKADENSVMIYDWRNETGSPEYVFGGATSLTLVPTPDLEGTLKLTVVLKPSPTAIGMDDDIFNEYREGIMHGALARLMLSPKKPYTDPNMATFHQQMFAVAAGHAGVRAARNFTRAPLQTAILSRGRRWG